MAGKFPDPNSYRTDNAERSREFPVQEIIWLLYRFSQPDNDPEIRKRIMKAAGCSEEVLQLPPFELARYLKKHSRASALFLMMLEISACRICDYYTLPTNVSSFRETARLFMRHYLYRPYEQLTAVACDSKQRITDEIYVFPKGEAISASASMRDLVRYAINAEAKYIIVAHNHPVSVPVPSQEDTHATEHISNMLSSLGITLADHIIINGATAFSMRLSGKYSYIFTSEKFYKDNAEPLYSFINGTGEK